MQRLREAREIAGYTQEDVALALGVNRVVVSYWETGSRRPSDGQLLALSRVLGFDIERLLSDEPLEVSGATDRMLFRGAEKELPAPARRGLREFQRFLDGFTALAEALQAEMHSMRQSPFTSGEGFDGVEDARRKAEQVRAALRAGMGPIDVDDACAMLGVTVFKAPLGQHLSSTISGAFFSHAGMGFALLVNAQMTPGRRRFTAAHELGHALFHDANKFVLSFPGRKDKRERFADAFAGEFLMPAEGMRRVMEEHGLGKRITDPADAIFLQRYYKVSYPTALVRLRQAKYLSFDDYERFKSVRPVAYARALGYEIAPEEFGQDPEDWQLRRYPSKFLRLLRRAVQQGHMSVPSAAEFTGVSIPEMAEFAAQVAEDSALSAHERQEIAEFADSGLGL